MIRVIIVEDEPLAQEILQRHIQRFGELELIGTCAHALDAFKLLVEKQVDLMFLDIRMPSINGIDFFKSLKNPPRVIFTTAFAEYAQVGFDLDAVDYLMKPISYERFEQSMKKFFRVVPEQKTETRDHTYFKVSGVLVKVNYHDLIYAQSVKDYIQIKITNKNILTHMTMKALAELLPPDRFVRVHRSYIINIDHINAIERHAIRIGELDIPIGEHYRDGMDAIFRMIEKR